MQHHTWLPSRVLSASDIVSNKIDRFSALRNLLLSRGKKF
jgi:hypothetical protein